MSVSLESLELDQLSVSERLGLIEKIWSSLSDVPPESLLSPAQRTEIERRIEQYRNDPNVGLPWDEVKSRLEARRG
jgi:putative addiction module component (TIGR02574 family)